MLLAPPPLEDSLRLQFRSHKCGVWVLCASRNRTGVATLRVAFSYTLRCPAPGLHGKYSWKISKVESLQVRKGAALGGALWKFDGPHKSYAPRVCQVCCRCCSKMAIQARRPYADMLYTLQKPCQIGLPISGVGLLNWHKVPHKTAETPGSIEMEGFKELFEMVPGNLDDQRIN